MMTMVVFTFGCMMSGPHGGGGTCGPCDDGCVYGWWHDG